MSDGISHDFKIEGPGPGTRREDAGIMIEYLGVRLILGPRVSKPRDRGVWLIIQTEDGEEDILEFEVTRDGTKMPPPDVLLVEVQS